MIQFTMLVMAWSHRHIGTTRPWSGTYHLYFRYFSGPNINWRRAYLSTTCHKKKLENILDAVVWRWCHCNIMVILRRHAGPVNHDRLTKYFISSLTLPIGTTFTPRQIELFTLKKRYNLMHPSEHSRLVEPGYDHLPEASLVWQRRFEAWYEVWNKMAHQSVTAIPLYGIPGRKLIIRINFRASTFIKNNMCI